jgi:hypothetical protein
MLHRLPLTRHSQAALCIGSRVHARKSSPAKKAHEKDQCDSDAKADLALRTVEAGLLNPNVRLVHCWYVCTADSN